MFESAEVGNKVDKKTYKEEAARLRADLLAAQKELAESNFSVVITVAGVGGAGKSEIVNLLLDWMDARGIRTYSLDKPTDEEKQRPGMWRYWRLLPPCGQTSIFFGSWDTDPILDCVHGRVTLAELDLSADRIVDFEQMLHNENTLLIKFWLHLSRKAQKKRLRKLEADPEQRWRVTREDWKLFRCYKVFRRISEHLLRRTSTGEAPWTIVEGTDWRYRNLAVGRALLQSLRFRLEHARQEPARPEPHRLLIQPEPRNVINQLDLGLNLNLEEYKDQLKKGQADLNGLIRQLRTRQRSLILVFEGPDAAGKGGTIRRIIAAMDARDYQVISVAAPTDEERAHPYLWRFWRHLPRRGRVTLYDRSWYGRVLVERVEGFCTQMEWQRAYAEINGFEEQLSEAGIIVHKFWLAISPEEQLARFKVRETTPYKQYKLTEEDWRNRDRWDSYEAAACDMIEKTSVDEAPWTLIEANNKEWARIRVLKTVIQRLKSALEV
jgi:AMP-polyphosphate phosphotransferase